MLCCGKEQLSRSVDIRMEKKKDLFTSIALGLFKKEILFDEHVITCGLYHSSLWKSVNVSLAAVFVQSSEVWCK